MYKCINYKYIHNRSGHANASEHNLPLTYHTTAFLPPSQITEHPSSLSPPIRIPVSSEFPASPVLNRQGAKTDPLRIGIVGFGKFGMDTSHPVNAPCRHTLSIHPLSTPCRYTLSIHPVNKPSQYMHPLTPHQYMVSSQVNFWPKHL